MILAKNYENASTFVKVIQIKLLASFFRTRCTPVIRIVSNMEWMGLQPTAQIGPPI